ncbi:DNA repair protein [Massilia sp. Root418]|uniref:non-homologous end joining protein Ku n=1 Tax=Massilia sp. Root418 TaxID=1736532 RepID=UPI0006F440F8|nr:Ku protein [Massilia sp. Root418]KQX01996.1 DNA repair protein [Massilia sp. Root418]
MARSLWKGAISFGLVHIPVEMHTAVQSHDLDLTMLDKRDFSPIGFKRYNKSTGKDVTWDNIIKGYEYKDGEYVVLSDEDLRQANVEATQTIDILAFVDAADVPLTYYETPYYLAPGRGGDKVYALLRETLRKAGRIAIATVVIRVRQHLCALVCVDDSIILNTLRFAEEIRSTEDLKLPPKSMKSAGISDKELQMALSLVEGMTEEWHPEQYHDTYKNDVLALVEKKVKARQTKSITVAAPEKKEAASSNVVDLVALLKQSLGGAGKGKGKAAEPEEAQEPQEAEESEDEEEAAPRARKPAASKAGASKARPARAAAKPAAKTASKTAAKTAEKAKPRSTATPARRKAA